MDKEIFESLKRGLKEAEAFKRGDLKLHAYSVKIEIPDVKEIRKKTGLTQEEFAALFGWSKDAVSSWEQGRRAPDHSAKVMLKLIAKDPAYVLETMRA